MLHRQNRGQSLHEGCGKQKLWMPSITWEVERDRELYGGWEWFESSSSHRAVWFDSLSLGWEHWPWPSFPQRWPESGMQNKFPSLLRWGGEPQEMQSLRRQADTKCNIEIKMATRAWACLEKKPGAVGVEGIMSHPLVKGIKERCPFDLHLTLLELWLLTNKVGMPCLKTFLLNIKLWQWDCSVDKGACHQAWIWFLGPTWGKERTDFWKLFSNLYNYTK